MMPKIETIADAVKRTNDIVLELDPWSCYQTFIVKFNADVIQLKALLYRTSGVAGWYYNTETREFCTDVLTREFILAAIRHIENQNK